MVLLLILSEGSASEDGQASTRSEDVVDPDGDTEFIEL